VISELPTMRNDQQLNSLKQGLESSGVAMNRDAFGDTRSQRSTQAAILV